MIVLFKHQNDGFFDLKPICIIREDDMENFLHDSGLLCDGYKELLNFCFVQLKDYSDFSADERHELFSNLEFIKHSYSI